ncbi:MAG: hypothetical protein WC730_03280 [Patescibacteria group bacterium]|jgi:hypothetical protein
MSIPSIAKTGCFSALIAYLFFWFADYWRPGFVSAVFSVHWFLFVMIFFVVLWCVYPVESKKSVSIFLTGLLSLFCVIILWREGDLFGDWLPILIVLGFLTPWIGKSLLSSSSQ